MAFLKDYGSVEPLTNSTTKVSEFPSVALRVSLPQTMISRCASLLICALVVELTPNIYLFFPLVSFDNSRTGAPEKGPLDLGVKG